MKTNKNLAMIALFTLGMLAGCGETPASSASPASSTAPASETPASSEKASSETPAASSASADDYTGYQVTVLYPDGTPAKEDDDISVQWCDENTCKTPVSIDDNGVAKNEKLTDGEYSVHLLNLPSEYTYNPNIYTTSATNKQIVINLVDVAGTIGPEYNEDEDLLPDTGNETADKALAIEKSGVYNVTITADGELQYFSVANVSGFEAKSWARFDTYVNNIDPFVNCYDTDGTTIKKTEDGLGNPNFDLNDTVSGTQLYSIGLVHTSDMDNVYSGYFPVTFAVEFTLAA